LAAELSRQRPASPGTAGAFSRKFGDRSDRVVSLRPQKGATPPEASSPSEDEELFATPTTTTQFVFTIPPHQAIGIQGVGPEFFSGLNFIDPGKTVASAIIEPPKPDKRSTMSDPTREEIAAKLDVISAQTDAKFERVLGEMRTANAEIIGQLTMLGAQVQSVKDVATEAKAAAQFTRWQIFFWVLAAFGAAIGTAALVHSNTQSVAALVQTAIAVKH